MKDLQPAAGNTSPDIAVALLKPEMVRAIIDDNRYSDSDTVERVEDVLPTDTEKASGVTSVEVVHVHTATLVGREEFLRPLSKNFKSAIVRLLHHPDGDTTQVVVETYFGDPVAEGSHTSERHQRVYEFDSAGVVTGGYQQTIKEHWHEPSKNPSGTGVNETLVGDPIVGDDLNNEAAVLVKDINICASAGK